jgi:hypothetical protein
VLAKRILIFALGVPLCLALDTASCGPTCGTLLSCGTSSGTGDAGANGSATTCPQLTAQQDCLTAFCQTADNPFCTCYKRGFDLAADCTCTAFDAAASASFCQQNADNDAASFDCSAATGAVAPLCVNVQ